MQNDQQFTDVLRSLVREQIDDALRPVHARLDLLDARLTNVETQLATLQAFRAVQSDINNEALLRLRTQVC